MAAEGRAILLPQRNALADRLITEAERLMADPILRMALAQPVSNLAVESCLEDLAEQMT
jgi:hypothetical protein